MQALSVSIGLAGALALALAVPAMADVKAGVDAWTRGDYSAAVAEWKGPAAKGDADAQFNLAQAYRLGRGVPADLALAESYYAKAAAQGHVKAADNYGLLLFQGGRREQAMPYVTAAADRGDPRAQYLLGIAHFNGDLMAKDWVRAYALLTLSNAAGLPQAAPAIKQMDGFIPLDQRQQAQSLAVQMKQQADANRAAQLASADLSLGHDDVAAGAAGPAVRTAPPAIVHSTTPEAAPVATPRSVLAAEAAVAEAMRATGTESPATAGADFARPATSVATPLRTAQASPPTRPALRSATTSAPPPTPAASAAPAAAVVAGSWKVQLGAFSIAGNADKLWAQVRGSAALTGKQRTTERAGRLTKLQAGPFPTKAAADDACRALKQSGRECLVTR